MPWLFAAAVATTWVRLQSARSLGRRFFDFSGEPEAVLFVAVVGGLAVGVLVLCGVSFGMHLRRRATRGTGRKDEGAIQGRRPRR